MSGTKLTFSNAVGTDPAEKISSFFKSLGDFGIFVSEVHGEVHIDQTGMVEGITLRFAGVRETEKEE